ASLSCAAVLGRPGEVEPVAAALGHALRRRLRSRTATVIVLGGQEPAHEGGGASRQLAAQLRAHGLPAGARGRPAWVPREPGAAAKAGGAAMTGEPVVLAIGVPRTASIDGLLNEQDLVIVVSGDPEGPLVQVVAESFALVSLRIAPPLRRGPLGALARAGLV